MRFEVLTAVIVRACVFRDVTPYNLVQRYEHAVSVFRVEVFFSDLALGWLQSDDI
jgi:hypothetical protein